MSRALCRLVKYQNGFSRGVNGIMTPHWHARETKQNKIRKNNSGMWIVIREDGYLLFETRFCKVMSVLYMRSDEPSWSRYLWQIWDDWTLKKLKIGTFSRKKRILFCYVTSMGFKRTREWRSCVALTREAEWVLIDKFMYVNYAKKKENRVRT